MNELDEKYADKYAELEYKEAKQIGEDTQDLFYEIFEFDEVETFSNCRKVEIIEKLREL